jgi:hypothetical protein
MPYTIKKVSKGENKGKYALILDKTKKTLGFHSTKNKALKQIQAIEINKHKKINR